MAKKLHTAAAIVRGDFLFISLVGVTLRPRPSATRPQRERTNAGNRPSLYYLTTKIQAESASRMDADLRRRILAQRGRGQDAKRSQPQVHCRRRRKETLYSFCRVCPK